MKGIRAFGRIAHSAVVNCHILEEVSRNRGRERERERGRRGKGRLIQQMVVITLPL